MRCEGGARVRCEGTYLEPLCQYSIIHVENLTHIKLFEYVHASVVEGSEEENGTVTMATFM